MTAIAVASRRATDEAVVIRALYAGWSATDYGADSGFIALLRPHPRSFPAHQQADRLRSFGGIRVIEDPTPEDMEYLLRRYGGEA